MSYHNVSISTSPHSSGYGATGKIDEGHDGFCMVFSRNFGEHKLYIREAPDGDELICEPPLEIPRLQVRSNGEDDAPFLNENLCYNLKNPNLDVSRFTKYTLTYSKEHPEHFIYCVVSINEEEAMEWADAKEIELEADAEVAVREGRKVGFQLALNTALPGEEDNKVHFKGDEYDKLSLDVWQNMHLPYSISLPAQDLYKRHGSDHELLENRMQLKILHQILTEDERLGGAGFMIDSMLLASHPLLYFFALNCEHDNEVTLTPEELNPCWPCSPSNWFSLWTEKIEPIRSYYGEVVAFYFAFLAHYTKTMIPFAIVGTLYFLVQASVGKISINPIASLVVVLVGITWSTTMIERWYRREWELRYNWGMMRAAETAVPRAEFEGAVRVSPTTGELFETYSSMIIHYGKLCCSAGAIFFMMAIVISIVFGFFFARRAFAGPPLWWSIVIGICNAIEIQIMNYFYLKLVIVLNGWEDHRLQSDYDNHMVVKKIVFYCVNSFNSLFLLAFVNPEFCTPSAKVKCDGETVLRSVRIQLVTLFATMIVINNTMEFVLPKFMVYFQEEMMEREDEKREEAEKNLLNDGGVQGASTKVFAGRDATYQTENLSMDTHQTGDDKESQAIEVAGSDDDNDEKEDVAGSLAAAAKAIGAKKAAAYTGDKKINAEIFKDIEEQMDKPVMPATLDQFAEIVVQYGYIMLFIIVFPIMPLLAILNNLIEQRVDLYNVINSQRPVPRSSGGIGVWKNVMSTLSIVAVFSNMGLVVYRSEQVSKLVGPLYQHIFFFVACIAILGIQFLIRVLLPDIPVPILEGIERQEYCEKYLIIGGVKSELKRVTRVGSSMSNAQVEVELAE